MARIWHAIRTMIRTIMALRLIINRLHPSLDPRGNIFCCCNNTYLSSWSIWYFTPLLLLSLITRITSRLAYELHIFFTPFSTGALTSKMYVFSKKQIPLTLTTLKQEYFTHICINIINMMKHSFLTDGYLLVNSDWRLCQHLMRL